MDMTKFDSADDPGFMAVTGELRRWIRELARSQDASLPQLEFDRLQGNTASEDSGGRMGEWGVVRITQGGSHFHGPTTVSGGLSIQGNYIGSGGLVR
jgi:hypothetical protein